MSSDTKTLRDEFAMAALMGWAAGRNRGNSFDGEYGLSRPDIVAGGCYRYADAMLAERAKQPAPGMTAQPNLTGHSGGGDGQ